MPDDLDRTEERIEFDTDIAVKNVCNCASKIEPGQPGDCDLCGEYFCRVIQVEKDGKQIQACGRCRDKHRIK